MNSFIRDHYKTSAFNALAPQRRRQLWAHLTQHRHERLTLRSIQDALGYSSVSVVAYDLQFLEDAGYIARPPARHATGIRVLIPMVEMIAVDILAVPKVDPYRAQRELERWLFGGMPERGGRR